MSAIEMEQQRHAEEKGRILLVLKDEYASECVLARTLLGVLDRLGYPMAPDALEFALVDLAQRGYVGITRARETAGWRKDRPMSARPDAVVTARLLPRGLDLIDATIAADAKVAF